MLRVILIDDEPIGLNTLKVLIERLDMGVSIVGTATDPEKGISLIETYQPDVVFLDVNMPGLNGFELLEKLQFKNFKLVFTTAHREYAIKAIKHKAHDYLLKPIDSEDLKSCLEKILAEPRQNPAAAQKQGNFVELHVSDGIVLIKQSNIVRLEASGSYTFIYLKDGTKHTASKNLKHFESLLDQNLFYRTHQSNIINLLEVTKLVSQEGYYTLMSDKSTPEVSKKAKDALLLKLKEV